MNMAVAAAHSLHENTAPIATRGRDRRVAGVAFGAHALHDGYTDLIYVLLPLWQKEVGVGFAELGLPGLFFAGTVPGFQIPACLPAERFGPAAVLALGTALTGIGYCLAGASAGTALLMIALFCAGLG